MRTSILAALSMVAAAASAQTVNSRSIPVNGAAGPDEMLFSVIQFGSSTTYPEGGAFVLGGNSQWKDFLRHIGDSGKHPFVDWKTDQLIVVQLAPSDAAPLGFRIARLRRRHGEIDVELVLNKPYGAGISPRQPRTLRNQVSAYEVIETRKFDGPVKTVVVDE